MTAKEPELPTWFVGLQNIIWGEGGDRGLFIGAIAFLQAHLEQLLRRSLVDAPKEADRLLSSLPFAAQTRLAYLLGLIPQEIAADLDGLRSIRNDLAHSFAPAESEAYVSRLRALYVLNDPGFGGAALSVDAAEYLKAACYIIARYLERESGAVPRHSPKPPFVYTPP